MDVSCIVVATSEVIRFEKGAGIFVTGYNTSSNVYFYILVKDDLVKLWKKVFVNRIYNFSHLKIAAVELLSGIRKITLLATKESEFEETLEYEQQKIDIPANLLKNIAISIVTFNAEINSFTKVISYQGIVTKVKNTELGLYEIDGKIHLYCIFNSTRCSLSVFELGCEVFVSNAHFLKDFKGRKVLVCCGLSSVRSLDLEEEKNPILASFNFSHHFLSIFDVVWLEFLFIKLNEKLCSTIISPDFVFDWKNDIVNKILECFSKPVARESYSDTVLSIGDEYCSSPHSCNVFCNDVLPTGCEILYISEVLDKASSNILWTESSESWKTSSILNESKHILIGMLQLAKDGSWYIIDESCDIPIVFTPNCSKCKFSKSTLCFCDNLNLGYLIALQNFEIIYEQVKYKNSTYNYYRYFRTSPCFIFNLGTFYKEKDNLFHLLSVDVPSMFEHKQCCSVDDISKSLQSTHLSENYLLTNDEEQNTYMYLHKEDLVQNNSSQFVLVLNKIWTVIEQAFICYQVFVLLLPHEEVSAEYLDKSRSLFHNASNNFYETDDDYDFAELVNQMDSLFLENKPKLARLHFESTRQCASLLPGHMYTIDLSGNFTRDAKFSVPSDKSSLKPIMIKIKSSLKILHHVDCLGNHSPDDYEIDPYNSVKDLIIERKVNENYLIRAVLKNKCYEESRNRNSYSENELDRTFCLTLKDCDSDDTIKVYLPVCPKNMYGLLPGTLLQMWGFICVCSKRGQLYLKPCSSFGIQIINPQPFEGTNESFIDSQTSDSDEKCRLSLLQSVQSGSLFKCLCFIVKIVSVKLCLICNSCGKDFEVKCSCFCSYYVKMTISFIVDDGTEQTLVHSSDEAARKVLVLSDNEFEKLSSFVTETRTSLSYHYKMQEMDIKTSVVEDVFSLYCSHKFLCRQVFLKCKKASDGMKVDQQGIWCYDVLQITETDIIPEFIIGVKKAEA